MILHAIFYYIYCDTLLLVLSVNLTFAGSYLCYRADERY